ncbi:MAG: NUDIX domain-containing protein [Gammaproteobacteria bacterium]|nr:NUDIX domain-containing protein [Gammaproteobacteria bacterium]
MKQTPTQQVSGRFSVNVVENGDGEILLLKRSKDSRYGPGLWGFPAGHLEEGETPEQCATRELIEEIGPDISVEPIKQHEPVRDEIAGEIYEFHLFHLRWLGGEIRLNHEHTDYAWVSRDDYRHYPVMRGVDLDLRYLNVWPGYRGSE